MEGGGGERGAAKARRAQPPLLGCCGFRRRDEEAAPLREDAAAPCAAGRRGARAPEEGAEAEPERAALRALARLARAADGRPAEGRGEAPGGPPGGPGRLEAEGLLAAARGLLGASLAAGWLLPGTRRDLERAAELVGAAHQRLHAGAQPEGRRGAVFCHGDPLVTLLETEPVDTWLLQTFTAADMEAAEGHHSATPSGSGSGKGSGCPARRQPMPRRLRSSSELDQTLATALHDTEAELLLERAGCLDFDSLSFSALPNVAALRPLQVLAAHSLDRRGLVRTLCDQGQVPEAMKFHMCLVRFLGEIDELYRPDVPYHNALHAVDVMMTMEWFLTTAYLRKHVSPLDHLMALVASAIHDVGHPGRNNIFLAKTMSPEAIRYNDKSILENMHLALSFEAMQADVACNWFALLPRAFQRSDDEPGAPAVNVQHYVRRGLIDMVLGTDMAKHAEHVRHLQEFLQLEAEGEAGGGSPSAAPRGAAPHARKQEALDRKLFLLVTTLHAADISNPCKPRPSMLRWGRRVLEEFWAQGDEERALSMDISPLCDRESGRLAVAKGQLGFINFVVQPLYSPLAQLVPEVREAAELLAESRSFWEDLDGKGALPEDIFGP